MRRGTRIATSLAFGLGAGGLAFMATHVGEGHERDTGAQHYEAEVVGDVGPYVAFLVMTIAVDEGIEETERRRWEAKPSEPPIRRNLRIVPNPNSDHPPTS